MLIHRLNFFKNNNNSLVIYIQYKQKLFENGYNFYLAAAEGRPP